MVSTTGLIHRLASRTQGIAIASAVSPTYPPIPRKGNRGKTRSKRKIGPMEDQPPKISRTQGAGIKNQVKQAPVRCISSSHRPKTTDVKYISAGKLAREYPRPPVDWWLMVKRNGGKEVGSRPFKQRFSVAGEITRIGQKFTQYHRTPCTREHSTCRLTLVCVFAHGKRDGWGLRGEYRPVSCFFSLFFSRLNEKYNILGELQQRS